MKVSERTPTEDKKRKPHNVIENSVCEARKRRQLEDGDWNNKDELRKWLKGERL